MSRSYTYFYNSETAIALLCIAPLCLGKTSRFLRQTSAFFLEKSPLFFGKSPLFLEKSGLFLEKSGLFLRWSLAFDAYWLAEDFNLWLYEKGQTAIAVQPNCWGEKRGQRTQKSVYREKRVQRKYRGLKVVKSREPFSNWVLLSVFVPECVKMD